MPRDGSGVHTLDPGYLAVTGQTVLPSNHNPALEDLSNAITESIARTGVTSVTADIPFGGFKLTGVGAATNPGDAVNRETAEALISAAVLPGYLYGLTMSNNATDTANDVDIAAGKAASGDTVPVLMTLAASITKRLDAAWAVGTNQGGLDTGSISNGTYHVWLIRRPDTGVVDALFSTSASSPTMPTNYTQKRRIGSITRPSGSIALFSQAGDEFTLLVPRNDVSASQGATSTLRTLSVPLGIRVFARIAASVTSTALSKLLLVSDTDLGTIVVSSTNATLGVNVQAGAGSNVGATGMMTVRTDEYGQVRTYCDATHTITLTTFGWSDDRGRTS